jgi:hypothetical protein
MMDEEAAVPKCSLSYSPLSTWLGKLRFVENVTGCVVFLQFESTPGDSKEVA